MGKRSNLYEIYFGPDDTKKSAGYDRNVNGALGSMHTLGSNYGIYDEPDQLEDTDDYADDIDISSKIDNMNNYSYDLGSKANRNSSYTGAYTNLTEKSNHTNTVVQGINPNMTYRGSKGQKVTKSSMSSSTYPKIYNKPRRDMDATYFGTSRAPLPRHDEDDDNIWSLSDIMDKHERSLNKHQTNINRIKKIINEIKL